MQEIDEQLARRLCSLTSEFYAANAASFSETRQAPWEGWQRILQCMVLPESGVLNVLDLGCGNLRFERFLTDELLGRRISCLAVDNCKDLTLSTLANEAAAPNPAFCEVSFQCLDIMSALSVPVGVPSDAGPGGLASFLVAPDATCDLAVSFGLMHHIPRFDWRVRLLQAMAAKVKPGGYVVVSCWRYMDDARLAAKARTVTSTACERLGLAQLPKDDHFLGWQGESGSVRYCHHFTSLELDKLVAALAGDLTLAARFRADGKNVPLNTYLVFQK